MHLNCLQVSPTENQVSLTPSSPQSNNVGIMVGAVTSLLAVIFMVTGIYCSGDLPGAQTREDKKCVFKILLFFY